MVLHRHHLLLFHVFGTRNRIIPQQGLRVRQHSQFVLIAEDARYIDQIAWIRAAVILNELVVDRPPVKCSIRRHEHAPICPRIANHPAQIRIFCTVKVRSVSRLVPNANKSHQDQERPVYNNRPSAHIAICPQCIRVFQARCSLSQSPQYSGPIHEGHSDQARSVEDRI